MKDGGEELFTTFLPRSIGSLKSLLILRNAISNHISKSGHDEPLENLEFISRSRANNYFNLPIHGSYLSFFTPNFVVGRFHPAYVIQIDWMATFPHLLIE